PGSKKMDTKEIITLSVPQGIELAGGKLGDTKISEAKTSSLPDGGKAYQFVVTRPHTTKTLGRLYIRATGWTDGQKGNIHYSFKRGDCHGGELSIPVRAMNVKPAPRLKDIIIGMGWWAARTSKKWPNTCHAYKVRGINTFSLVPPRYKRGK